MHNTRHTNSSGDSPLDRLDKRVGTLALGSALL